MPSEKINNDDIDFIRNLAVSYEKTNLLLAYELISIALRCRPNGHFIVRKKKEYEAQSIKIKPKNLMLEKGLKKNKNITNQISGKDINYIRDLAVSLGKSNPKQAFELMAIALRSRPKGAFIRWKKNVYKKRFFNKVLTARTDGLTERINAIFNGLLISDRSNKDFLFSWIDSRVVGDQLHDVSKDLPDIFNASFIAKHYVPAVNWSYFRVHGEPQPRSERISGHIIGKPLPPSSSSPINIVPNVGNCSDFDYSEIVRRVFNAKYISLFDEYSNLNHCLGIHYRGGDVIYGINRHGKHAMAGKSAPLSIVEYLINQNKEQSIVVFGTPTGDTLDDLLYLNEKYPNVTLSKNLAQTGYHPVIQDCIMMSACMKLIGMKGTGILRLACKFKQQLDVEYFEDIIQGRLLRQLLMDGVGNTEYNSLQRSYHAIRALAAMPEKNDYLLKKIRLLDPGNKLCFMNDLF